MQYLQGPKIVYKRIRGQTGAFPYKTFFSTPPPPFPLVCNISAVSWKDIAFLTGTLTLVIEHSRHRRKRFTGYTARKTPSWWRSSLSAQASDAPVVCTQKLNPVEITLLLQCFNVAVDRPLPGRNYVDPIHVRIAAVTAACARPNIKNS